MHPDGEIHWEDLDKLVDFHIENGTHGIVAVGTTGESATLDPKEHCRVIGHIIKRVAGRIPVIAGTGGNSTREAIELTTEDRKSTRLNSSHVKISYAVFCLKKKKKRIHQHASTQ